MTGDSTFTFSTAGNLNLLGDVVVLESDAGSGITIKSGGFGPIQVGISGDEVGFFGTTPVAQPTTGIAEAAFTTNSGTSVNVNSTFDGYTLQQVVKALRDEGLLG